MTFLSNLPHNLFVVAVFLTMLVVLVGAHEMGHYLFARLFGMATEEFAIGMFGKPLVVLGKRRYLIPLKEDDDPNFRGEANPLEGGAMTEPTEVVDTPSGPALRETTVFTIRPWPLGGFVRIKGMIPQEDGGETRVPGGFFSKEPWKRWIVLAAGPAFSVLAGILLIVPMLMFEGEQTLSKKPVFGSLSQDSKALAAGFKEGDRIVSVDGKPVKVFYDMMVAIRDKGSEPITLVALRDGKKVEKTFVGAVDKEPTPVFDENFEETGVTKIQTKIGVLPPIEKNKYALGSAVVRAVKMPGEAVAGLAKRVMHPAELKKSVGGPGTMVKQTSIFVDAGFWPMIGFAGTISISLGIFNLLPFPPLDGGQMWIAFVEMLRGGRRLSLRTQLRVINVGFAMVMLLVATVLVIDVQRWTGYDSAPGFEKRK
jgi:regulator of sigma E protease